MNGNEKPIGQLCVYWAFYIGRGTSASTATGTKPTHQREFNHSMEAAMSFANAPAKDDSSTGAPGHRELTETHVTAKNDCIKLKHLPLLFQGMSQFSPRDK
uniref:Uncharacterized protein n=1 Tax=Anopheles albimanus TaxID=7167 RepID=A0A182FXP2_ANOAL